MSSAPGPPDAPGRTRSYGWAHPAAYTAVGPRSGIELLRALVDGELPSPPMAETLGMALVEVGDGSAVFTAEPQEWHLNPAGVVHGGLALTLIDSATGCAVLTRLAAGVAYTTLETKANFVRAITPGSGVIRCSAETVHVGRSTATAQARVEDDQGRLLAHGSSTMIILRDGA